MMDVPGDVCVCRAEDGLDGWVCVRESEECMDGGRAVSRSFGWWNEDVTRDADNPDGPETFLGTCSRGATSG